MALTNFPNGISSFGVPVIGSGIPASRGKYIFVDYTTGTDGGPLASNSVSRPYKTIAAAYAQATSNNDDVIVLMGSATHVLTEMLTVSKNRVHFVGMDGTFGRMYGQNAKVSLGVTTAATDIGTILNTGVRNSFTNIKFINNNTVTEGVYCFVEGGEYTLMNNCEIYKSTDLDVTGAAELVMNGDSAQFINCTIGSLADARSGAVIRPNVLFTKGLAGSGKVARDVLFSGCKFWIQCTNTANRFVYGANATDVERVAEFDNCAFICNGASTAIPAQNVAFGATLTVGAVLLNRCTSLLASTAMSTTTGVFVDGAVPAAATTGISLQAS
jgi:hypothetical protein